jgi:hypothetical protein
MLIYHQLTKEFNQGRARAILCSGQAVVMHRLAITSKDGDWIVRETESDLAHLRQVLADHGATYRFGAPLDVRWLAAGWSAHLEFHHHGIRVRTDFFTRPPRLTESHLASLWQAALNTPIPYTGLKELALMKMTMREKDYPIIGELARRFDDIDDQLLFSRSARDLVALAASHPEVITRLMSQRPLLAKAADGEDALAVALDAERRTLMKADEARLSRYQNAAQPWESAWPCLSSEISHLPLPQAHENLCAAALNLLPTTL